MMRPDGRKSLRFVGLGPKLALGSRASRAGASEPLTWRSQCNRQNALSDMVGEARAYVQGATLKARALFHVRVLNSPITNRRVFMKISEAIRQLQDIETRYGDIAIIGVSLDEQKQCLSVADAEGSEIRSTAKAQPPSAA